MNLIENLPSVINDTVNALDNQRAFTFIEFVKVSGEQNEDDSIIALYKDYLTKWTEKQKFDASEQKDFVQARVVELLKTITLTYSSYEEKQFISQLDWSNIENIKTIIPLYVKRINEICNFYRQKRTDAFFIIEKNKKKGSALALEQIIYDTIVDFVFNNKNVLPQLTEIKRNLSISIENYIDTYSDYFDITRDKSIRDKQERAEPIEANINDVDYRDYIEINTVIAEIIYSGEVYLEEIPLIANLGMDFSQECVGQLLEVKNKLLAEATINLVPLTEKIALRRKLYEKYVGCDLYYMYVDDKKNVKIDLLVKASNPSGNLLNCGSPDTVTTPGNQLKLLSNIGLFFKPDKTSILKVNAKEYTWEVDATKLLEDTVYVFPDPSKYGDIGNNKDPNYPLIMEYKLDYDIRNLSSGNSCDDPLVFIDSQIFSSYYSKQQDVFKLIDNKNFDYSFTSLENFGIIKNYQTDSYGNEFAIFKGYKEVYAVGPDGKQHLDHVEVPENFLPETIYPNVEEEKAKKREDFILINGGYFEDPFHKGKPFDFTKKLEIDDHYRWTGLILGEAPLVTPEQIYDTLDFGEFGSTNGIQYIDHFRYTASKTDSLEEKKDLITEVVEDFYSTLFDNDKYKDVPVVKVKRSFVDFESESGTVLVKLGNAVESKPQGIMDVFYWLPDSVKKEEIVSFSLTGTTLVLETKNNFVFVNYSFDGNKISEKEFNKKTLVLKKDKFSSNLLYVAKDKVFYVAMFKEFVSDKGVFLPTIYKFTPETYRLQEVYCVWNFVDELKSQFETLKNKWSFDPDMIAAKNDIIDKFLQNTSNASLIKGYVDRGDLNIDNFSFNYEGDVRPEAFKFSYNSSLNMFLLSYVINSNNGFPYIYQHKFRLFDDDMFKDTIKSTVFSVSEAQENNFVLWKEKAIGGKVIPENTEFFVEI